MGKEMFLTFNWQRLMHRILNFKNPINNKTTKYALTDTSQNRTSKQPINKKRCLASFAISDVQIK